MNIYLYLKHFLPSGNDLNEGTRKSVHGLASGLVNNGASVTILCEGTRNCVHQSTFGYKIRCFVNSNSGSYGSVADSASFTIAPGFEEFFRSRKDDTLVILNGIFHRSVYSISRLLKKYSIPYIVAPHDPYHPSIFKKNAHLKLPYWYLFEKRVLNQAAAVQVLDKQHGKWLQKLHVQTPVIEVLNGFSPEDVPSDSVLKWRDHGSAKLFFLGRLDAYNKGLDLLLKAFSQVVPIADVELTIQGPDWGDRDRLEKQSERLGIGKYVTFLEPNYLRRPSELILKYDIFCLPSRFEGFGLSALEGILTGRVLIVSEVAGIASHVTPAGCGLIIRPDCSSIKAGILDLLRRRTEWKEMGLSGRHYALTHLHWNNIAASAMKQYEQLMNAKRVCVK